VECVIAGHVANNITLSQCRIHGVISFRHRLAVTGCDLALIGYERQSVHTCAACVHEVALALNVLGNRRLFGKNECILGIDLSWPLAWRVEALQRHRALAVGCRDDLDLLLRVYYLWQSASEPFKWCSTWWINEDALQEAWSGAMDSVRNLSAAMKGKADRSVSPELGERARAVLTRAMVGIRYTRIDGATFRAIDTTSSEPQTAQLGLGELVEPGNNVLAFGRYRNHAEDDVESTVYISHVVQISDWALSNDLATAGLDLIVKCSQASKQDFPS
jgi:hypothetical protein